jgi:hypothetical protein
MLNIEKTISNFEKKAEEWDMIFNRINLTKFEIVPKGNQFNTIGLLGTLKPASGPPERIAVKTFNKNANKQLTILNINFNITNSLEEDFFMSWYEAGHVILRAGINRQKTPPNIIKTLTRLQGSIKQLIDSNIALCAN